MNFFFLKMLQKKIIPFITFVFLNFFNYVSAHEIKPTVVEFKKIENQINLVLIFNAEAFLANIDASVHKEIKNSSKSKIYDELRLLSKKMLKERIFKSKDQITNSIFVKTSEKLLKLKVVEIDVLDENNQIVVKAGEIIAEKHLDPISKMGLRSYREPKLPNPVRTFLVKVDLTPSFIRSTASFPASISTPADL